MEELHKRFPNLYLDNWTPAMGGADFGNFQRHHSMMMADWYTAVANRSITNGITHLFPPTRLHGYVRMFSPEDERSPYHYRSAFYGSGMMLLNDILLWDEETAAIAKREIALFKECRELFHQGEMYSLIDRQPDHYGWEARFIYDAVKARGVAQVFRNHDARQEHTICLRGLKANETYSVTFVDQGKSMKASGYALMSRGVTVRLDKPFTSEILHVRRGETKE
jgi:alpha-galactosidase